MMEERDFLTNNKIKKRMMMIYSLLDDDDFYKNLVVDGVVKFTRRLILADKY